MMAHPTQCAQFYDCSRPASLYGTYLHECQYPQMFDDVSGTCADFTAVNCGSRYEPKAPCKAFNDLTGVPMWNVDINKFTVVHAFKKLEKIDCLRQKISTPSPKDYTVLICQHVLYVDCILMGFKAYWNLNKILFCSFPLQQHKICKNDW